MIISYDYRHGTGNDRGASGYVIEETVVREYGNICVNELIRNGHTLVNCTPSGNMTLQESLSYRVKKSDASGAALHLCFHANAFKSTNDAMGSEMEVASDAGAKYGQSILTEVCKLGFKSRGVKRPSLYVTGHTKAICVLLEPFFVDSKADCNLYNPNSMGFAIAKGVIHIIGGTVKVETKPIINRILELQKVCNRVGIRGADDKALIEDGLDGLNTQSAKSKLKIYIDNILS
ncbi:N-acetylmuramoyl-L-alanine amidase [Clostridium sp. CF012]|uniref:N-acetylmuramoyl-L-alanine amidase n=1 Tax=Clostridium sp. CF012 TaxID=2843319 RepID=UPI001C0DE6AC|nr:N-acetylmuramoyl-L-alanine amidase [Clostridium sp. CF012]MBU3143959.1 N-acetylmuramoyl-L-alanine amidase [Clostridium sp. CF012]